MAETLRPLTLNLVRPRSLHHGIWIFFAVVHESGNGPSRKSRNVRVESVMRTLTDISWGGTPVFLDKRRVVIAPHELVTRFESNHRCKLSSPPVLHTSKPPPH